MTTMEKRLISCPLCEHSRADVAPRADGRFMLSCWSCEADGVSGGDWLRKVAAEVGAPGGGALLDDPWRWLAPYELGRSRRGDEPADLPSKGAVLGWHKALLSNEQALDYLLHERGLTLETIGKYRLGYAEYGAPGAYREWPCFTLPVFEQSDGKFNPRNLRKRFWPRQPLGPDGRVEKYVGLRGRGSQLYPGPPPESLRMLGRGIDAVLVAGEFDALLARQRPYRFPAVSTTLGAQLPAELAAQLVSWFPDGARIAVIYDVGEGNAARRAAEVLLEAGAFEAWAGRLGLGPKGADLTDYFMAGGTRNSLIRRILKAKPRAADA